jgi:multidrug efflux pump subunit AcrB
VFVPVAFMSGIAGEFFGPFSFTVVVAVLCSLLVARTLTPMMAAYFLKPHDRPERASRIMDWYLARVRWCLAHRWTTLAVASLAIGSMLGLFPLLSTAFSPAGDNGFTTLSVELAPGASLEDTLEAADTARRRLAALPEVRSVYTTVGAQGGGNVPTGGGSAGNVRRGSLVFQLDNPDGTRGAQQSIPSSMSEMRPTIGCRIPRPLEQTAARDTPQGCAPLSRYGAVGSSAVTARRARAARRRTRRESSPRANRPAGRSPSCASSSGPRLRR